MLRNIPENHQEHYLIFLENEGEGCAEKFDDFNTLNGNINRYTNKIAPDQTSFSDNAICLKIFKKGTPDLTLIDLPGIKYTAEEDKIKKLITNRIRDPNCIILFVMAAN
jgi:hypothetical protein